MSITGVVECDNAEIPMSPAPVVAVAVSAAVAVAVSITPECDIYPTAEAEAVFGINLAARPSPNNSDRAPVDCVVVLDVSGSMEGDKIALMRETVQLLLAEFTDKDRVGIVTFDTNVSEPVLLQPMTVASKASATAEVGKLKPGSMTNLSGGLFQGIQQLLGATRKKGGLFQGIQQLLGAAQDADERGRVRTCMLMTDGQANHGICTAAEIVPVLANMIRETGITLHTFGYGSDHDSGLLRALSNAGSGSYYFVEGVDAIRGAFGDCLGGILSVVAQNLQLIIEAENGAVITKVHHKSAQAVDGGRAFRVPFADLYGDEQRDVLVSLRLPVAATVLPVVEPGRGGNAPASVAASVVLRATLRYIDLLNAVPTTATAASGVTRASGEVAERAVRNNRIELQATRLRVAEALDVARAAAECRDLPAARAIVAAAQASLLPVQARCASAPGAADMMEAFKDDLEKCVQGLRDDRAFESARHEMANASEGHYQQRCMKSNNKDERAGSASAYKTSSKSAMASKFNGLGFK
jgi:Mg-chelatase subunit ChlD